MADSRVQRWYDEEYYGAYRQRQWIRLPLSKADYYGTPLRLLGVQRGRVLLDIACGTGRLLERAEALGLHCCGIDISEVAIGEARTRVKGELLCASVDDGLPYGDAFFDYVTCLGSLEHFANQFGVLSEMRRVAKSSCRICFLVPNDDYILHKLGYETDSQPVVNRYSLAGYTDLLQRSGLRIYRVLGDNSHLANLAESSSLLKLAAKLLLRPFTWLIPLELSYNFIFLSHRGVAARSPSGWASDTAG